MSNTLLRWRKGGLSLLAGLIVVGLSSCNGASRDGIILSPAALAAKQADAPIDPALAEADNDFGFRLFGELARKENDRNLFISPMSIALALDMTYNGAKGATAQGMEKALGLKGMSADTLSKDNAALMGSLSDPGPKVELAIANSLWIEPKMAVNPAFTQANQQYYVAEVAPLRSAAEINDWVRKHTRDKIQGIVNDDTVRGSVAILVNAIYFKGKWTKPFETSDTKPEMFTLQSGQGKQVQMMHQSGEYSYFQGEGFQVVQLPYGEGRLHLVVLLPEKGADYRAFLGRLTTANWKLWAAKFQETHGDIALPRFRIEYAAELTKSLTSLGMGQAFDAQDADFSGIAPGMHIDQVVHKTFLEVNEEGTEAAAATGVAMATGAAAPGGSFQMVVDHPFVCAIEDSKTKTILFFGSIVEPS
ncbi:MAG TPA: serpin family protein [Chthonomonadaceae bacterium]|nr:serpin family protein [Chthonomonadaceae bacterium]